MADESKPQVVAVRTGVGIDSRPEDSLLRRAFRKRPPVRAGSLYNT